MIQFRDTAHGWGLISRLFHWSFALAILGLFVLGYWMVGLDYYSPYYNSAPYWHKAIGMIFLILLLPRFLWRLVNIKPDDAELKPLERMASAVVHWGFYPLMAVMFISGYLIPTANGQPIDVFGLASIPSVIAYDGLEDAAGWMHWVSAYATLALAVIHTAAALKHHFADHGTTLTRMWSGPPRP